MAASKGHLSAVVRLRDGTPAGAGTQVNVYAAGGETPATLYRGRNGVTAVANPATVNADGQLDCYLASGAYDLLPVSTLVPPMLGVVVLPDAADLATVAAAGAVANITGCGTATLNGTTGVVVAAAMVTATSIIMLTEQVPGGTPSGQAYVFSRSVGVSFTLKSVASDTSTVGWVIVEPAA